MQGGRREILAVSAASPKVLVSKLRVTSKLLRVHLNIGSPHQDLLTRPGWDRSQEVFYMRWTRRQEKEQQERVHGERRTNLVPPEPNPRPVGRACGSPARRGVSGNAEMRNENRSSGERTFWTERQRALQGTCSLTHRGGTSLQLGDDQTGEQDQGRPVSAPAPAWALGVQPPGCGSGPLHADCRAPTVGAAPRPTWAEVA